MSIVKLFTPLLLLTLTVVAEGADLVLLSDTVRPGGNHSVTVANNSKVDLTGMLLLGDQHYKDNSKVHWRMYYDSFLNHDPRLAPGQSYTWELGSDAEDLEPMRLSVVAIFADGTAIGDPKEIKFLWNRRKWLAIGPQEVFHHIDVDVPDINNREQAAGILTEIHKRRIGPQTPPEERDSINLAYETVIDNLRDNHTGPPDKLIEGVRQDAMARIKAIQSQIPPPQVSQ